MTPGPKRNPAVRIAVALPAPGAPLHIHISNQEGIAVKRVLFGISALVAVGLLAALYFKPDPEAKRERSLEKARSYISQGKVNEAAIEFKNALKADPNSAEAHHEFGLALLRMKDDRGALRGVRRAAHIKRALI